MTDFWALKRPPGPTQGGPRGVRHRKQNPHLRPSIYTTVDFVEGGVVNFKEQGFKDF